MSKDYTTCEDVAMWSFVQKLISLVNTITKNFSDQFYAAHFKSCGSQRLPAEFSDKG